MKRKAKNTTGWVIVILILLGANTLASITHVRIDLTNEKRFTISQPVKNLLKSLPGEVQIHVFLQGDLPAGFKMLSKSTQELLQEFEEYAGGKLSFQFISPDEMVPGTQTTWADTLHAQGIVPINLKIQLKAGEQSQYIYPAAMATSARGMTPIDLYGSTRPSVSAGDLNSAQAMLEYRIASGIQRVTTRHRPIIAYATGNGEPTGIQTYDLVQNVLQKNYDVFTFDLTKEPAIPDTFKLFMVVKPTLNFSESEKLKLDQYVMRGGKLLIFVDRLNAEMDSLQIKNQVIAYDRGLGLSDLFFKYGVRINPDLILDLQSDFLPFSVNGKDQFELIKWNYFPLFESLQNSVIDKNLGLVAGRFVNSMDTVQAVGIKKTVLLSSSPNSRILGTPALISGAESKNAPEDEEFKTQHIIAGVLFEGKFTSLFRNRISRAMMDSLQAIGQPFVPENIENNKMIIVADGDIPLNETQKGEPLPMGVNSYTIGTQFEYQFANRQFVENCIEYLVNEGGLIEAKSKDYKLRLMDPEKVKNNRTFWQILNLAGPILLVILFGVVYQWWRKRKYSR